MSFVAGDVVLIPDVSYTNRFAAKARPCLVVSGARFNNSSADVILAPISSVIRSGDSKQVVIDYGHPGFPLTGLKVTSAVKCGAIFAYSATQIRRRLGTMPPEILTQVRSQIVDILTQD
jgi:mRNA-degrading endonuclease toxin of MazEF toxin-antitoxin module